MRSAIPASEFNKRMSVRRLKTDLTPDAAGHIDETDDDNWEAIAERWCQLVTKGSREFFRGEQVAAEITHQVTMRFDRQAATFTTGMQLKLGQRLFGISEPPRNVDERNTLLVFAAIEVK